MTKEQARTNLEDAIYHAREAGMTRAEVEDEVEYALDTADDEEVE